MGFNLDNIFKQIPFKGTKNDVLDNKKSGIDGENKNLDARTTSNLAKLKSWFITEKRAKTVAITNDGEILLHRRKRGGLLCWESCEEEKDREAEQGERWRESRVRAQVAACQASCWGSWGRWGSCSKQCLGGTKTRSRGHVKSCAGGCPGAATQSTTCNTGCRNGGTVTSRGTCSCKKGYQGSCCTSQAYRDMGEWSDCTKTCGGGTRSRSCHGSGCSGRYSEKCNTHSCDDGGGTSIIIIIVIPVGAIITLLIMIYVCCKKGKC